jgi:hypothetical protein
MSKSDEEAFLRFVRSTGDVLLIAQTSTRLEPERFEHFYDLEGRKLGENTCLWNRTISPPPQLKHIPEQGYYSIDFLESEVVSVRRPRAGENLSKPGRMHVELAATSFDGSLRSKSKEFQSWVNRLFLWIRKNYTRFPDGTYYGPGANSSLTG